MPGGLQTGQFLNIFWSTFKTVSWDLVVYSQDNLPMSGGYSQYIYLISGGL